MLISYANAPGLCRAESKCAMRDSRSSMWTAVVILVLTLWRYSERRSAPLLAIGLLAYVWNAVHAVWKALYALLDVDLGAEIGENKSENKSFGRPNTY